MRFLIWVVRIAVFVVLLGLALKNGELVTVRLFLGTSWQMPLVMVMLVCFAVGAAVGLTALLTTVFRLRRDLLQLRRESDRPAATPERIAPGAGDPVT